MLKKERIIRTPGESVAAAVVEEPQASDEIAIDDNSEGDSADDVPQAGAENEPQESAKPAVVRKEKPIPVPRAELKASDVDASKLTGPVLTSEGWVVPNLPERR